MLVLSRKPNESVIVAGNIRVTVLGVQGDRIRLGVEAPREITVDRLEIHEARQRGE